MRSPWIDLLFLHGHVTPAQLAWRPDAPACDCKQPSVEVDVAELPLHPRPKNERACCA